MSTVWDIYRIRLIFKINAYFSDMKLFYAYLKFTAAKQQMYNKFRWLDGCGN